MTAPGLSAEAVEAGRLLFARPCQFFFGVQRLSDLPPARSLEVAFAGRSNVGKSSLINALTGQRALARASTTPGRTQQLNFFDLGGRLTLVDMPGYGYAQAAKSAKSAWQRMMFGFLRGRPELRRVLLLLDARIEVKPADEQMMALLDRAAVPFQIVLTKADGLRPSMLAEKWHAARALIANHPAAHPELATTSAVTGAGLEALRATLAALAA